MDDIGMYPYVGARLLGARAYFELPQALSPVARGLLGAYRRIILVAIRVRGRTAAAYSLPLRRIELLVDYGAACKRGGWPGKCAPRSCLAAGRNSTLQN